MKNKLCTITLMCMLFIQQSVYANDAVTDFDVADMLQTEQAEVLQQCDNEEVATEADTETETEVDTGATEAEIEAYAATDSNYAVSFKVKGIFGGREVTFNCSNPDAEIYYTSENRSTLYRSDPHVSAGDTVTFDTYYYGTIYARTYYNGKWSNPSRLILKIPKVNTPTITKVSGNKYKISTTTPGCIIYYTLDDTYPSAENYAGKFWTSRDVTLRSGTYVTVVAVRNCFADSSSYRFRVPVAEHYEGPLPTPTLTGNLREDFIAVAKSQLGYMEAEDGSSYYGAWADQTYNGWCSEFAAWCAYTAGVPGSIFPLGRSSEEYRDFYYNKGRYYYLQGCIDGASTSFMNGYSGVGTISIDELQPGDLLLTESDGVVDDGPDHTAIFLEYKNGELYCISGNSSDMVSYGYYYLSEIHGVCKPKFE